MSKKKKKNVKKLKKYTLIAYSLIILRDSLFLLTIEQKSAKKYEGNIKLCYITKNYITAP